MLPADALRRHGVDLTPLPLFTADEGETLRSGSLAARTRTVTRARRRLRAELKHVQGADVVVVQRQADVFPTRSLERSVIGDRGLVLDIDDAMWLPQPGGHALGRLRGNASKLRWLAGRADRVVAGNEYLAEWCSRYARDVSVVPTLVDTEMVAPRLHRAGDVLTLGWIGSHTTAPYLRAIASALTAFAGARRDRQVRLIVVGGQAPAVAGVQVVQHAWSPESESAALARMDIGLMPLPDTAWTRGKCAYKALQYMAAAVPVIADDVGVSARVVGDGAAGIITRGHDGWRGALESLADDVDLRRRMGEHGRARVLSDFSVRVWAPRLARLIAGAS